MPNLPAMELIRGGLSEVEAGEALDVRLDEALHLLQTPPRNRSPGYVPLIAVFGFMGAAMFLAYMATKPIVTAKPVAPVTAVQASQAPAANPADFELSGSSFSAPSTESPSSVVVPSGSESAR